MAQTLCENINYFNLLTNFFLRSFFLLVNFRFVKPQDFLTFPLAQPVSGVIYATLLSFLRSCLTFCFFFSKNRHFRDYDIKLIMLLWLYSTLLKLFMCLFETQFSNKFRNFKSLTTFWRTFHSSLCLLNIISPLPSPSLFLLSF